MRALAFILPIIWIILGLLWYFPRQKERCCSTDTETSQLGDTLAQEGEIADIPPPEGPEYYRLGSVQPLHENDLLDEIREMYDDLDDNQILEIRGRYYGSESPPGEAENMGLARADYLKAALGDGIDDAKMAMSAFRLGDSLRTRGPYFRGVDLNAITSETPSVKQIEDRAEIRFEYGTDQRIEDPVIDQYLDDVAARVIQSGERIRLVGHTDSRSSPEYNLELGMRRANAIRDLLVSKGVNSSQVEVLSRGETEPVASNTTDAGRALNRRVDLQVIN
jgi:outer membrane protein OmpA-like peptidoglycan-associated protein